MKTPERRRMRRSSEERTVSNDQVQPRTFCRTVRRVASSGEVKYYRYGAEGKPSLKRAFKSVIADPKPGDLSMSRLKLP